MQRLALYIDDERFEWAFWDGQKTQTDGQSQSKRNAIAALEAVLAARDNRESIADIVVGVGADQSETPPPLPGWLQDWLKHVGLLDIRRAGHHARERPVFGWARTIALRKRLRSITVAAPTYGQWELLTYELPQDRFQYSRGPTDALATQLNECSDALVLSPACNAGDSMPTGFSNDRVRIVDCSGGAGALALGLLHSDIVLRAEAIIDEPARDSDIEQSFAFLMDAVFDSITGLGYDLDNALCLRELDVAEISTGAATTIEAPMRIRAVDLIQRIAEEQGNAATDFRLCRATVTGIVEPSRPGGERMIALLS